ncbi:hypothetical protein ACFWD7_48515 [Streptomyces mirabilis]|nr:hypothetical protein [Streptomyces mirabilis]MCT9111661.1 hypothetical protein [Streptomyces mirabilis]
MPIMTGRWPASSASLEWDRDPFAPPTVFFRAAASADHARLVWLG